MSKRKKTKTKAQFVPGYQAISWLAGQVFIKREFVKVIEEKGFEAIYDECPYDDLTDDQKYTFEDTFNRREMRLLVRIWWIVYDHLRKHGRISATRAPWRP